MNNFKIKILVAITFIPALAMANAGSPMMWFGMLHSLILNSVIGFFESSYLENREISNSMWIIIIGNYFSMFIGLWYIAPYFSSITGNGDFWGGRTRYGDYELNGFIFGMLASFIATLLLEFPFFYLSVKDKMKRKKGTWVYLEANTRSNVIMFIIYLMIVASGSKY